MYVKEGFIGKIILQASKRVVNEFNHINNKRNRLSDLLNTHPPERLRLKESQLQSVPRDPLLCLYFNLYWARYSMITLEWNWVGLACVVVSRIESSSFLSHAEVSLRI